MSAGDRRKIMVAITQEGRELVDRMHQNTSGTCRPDGRSDHEAPAIADTGKSIKRRRLG
ncbi:MAG: hypothetical protein ACLSUW_03880 [Akkermansia sp.]